MTPAQLADLWKKIVADDDIPWGYSPDCCYSRAHRMCAIAKGMGLDAKKVCVKPKPPATSVHPLGADGKPLQYLGRTVVWRYHVAVIVEVDIGGGRTEQRVLDPALCPQGPVTLDVWLAKMGGRAKLTAKVYDASVYYPGLVDPTGSDTEETLEKHRAQYQADLIDYINKNPGILDLPNPMVNPARGVLCSVNAMSQRRGDAFATFRFSNSVGALKVQFDHYGLQMIPFLLSWGLQRENPVVVRFDPRISTLASVGPAHRQRVLHLESAKQGTHVVTVSPTTYLLPQRHPNFANLQRMLGRAHRQGEEVLFMLEAGSSDLIENAVPASRFDRRRRSTEAPKRVSGGMVEGREI